MMPVSSALDSAMETGVTHVKTGKAVYHSVGYVTTINKAWSILHDLLKVVADRSLSWDVDDPAKSFDPVTIHKIQAVIKEGRKR